MQTTSDNDIVNEGWYWVKKISEPTEWVIMQAYTYVDYNQLKEINWWEVMKDWDTDHNEILIVGPKVEPPIGD